MRSHYPIFTGKNKAFVSALFVYQQAREKDCYNTFHFSRTYLALESVSNNGPFTPRYPISSLWYQPHILLLFFRLGIKMAANEPERRLLSAPLNATLYLGATRQGQTLFLGDGQGWVMRTRKTTGLVDAGKSPDQREQTCTNSMFRSWDHYCGWPH